MEPYRPRIVLPRNRIGDMESDRPRITLQQILMIVSVVCIWAAQAWIMDHYATVVHPPPWPFPDLPGPPAPAPQKFEPIETKVLGAVNFTIICAAIAFRRHGRITAWSAIAAAIIATLIASVVAAIRHAS